MKFVKRISLFFVCPLLIFAVGFYAGAETIHFFYPGISNDREQEQASLEEWPKEIVRRLNETEVEAAEAASSGETLSVDTEYVLEETDVVKHTVVETVAKLPGKYIGMSREQFVQAMEEYAMYPPLSELERGFIGLEVLSFAKERVVVQMNYHYVQPGKSFYIAVCNNEVVVYLEDKQTIYIYTGIFSDTLPEKLRVEIINMLFVEDEESLYNFLETYSS